MLSFLAFLLIAGRVSDSTGAPVPGVRLTARTASQIQIATVESGPDGRFSIDGLAPGAYLLRAEKTGFAGYQSALQVSAARNEELSVILSPSPVRSEITVTAEAGEVASLEQVAQRLNVISHNVMDERITRALVEAAAEEPGVAEQRTSPNMGSFFVRGLTGKNVAVYRDGVRYTTSAQRGGVSTFQNLVDPALLDSIEILRGPNSAQYGSDSIGGTVNLLSRTPEFATQGQRVSGDLGMMFDSATMGFGGQSRTQWSTQRFGLLAALAGRRINTSRTGGGIDSHAAVTRFLGLPSTVLGDRLPDTAFTQYSGSLHSQIQLAPTSQLVAHYERGQQDGAKRYDQLAGGDGNLIAELRNLMMDFGYLRFQQFQAGPFQRVSVSGSYNAQREERVNQGGQGNPNGAITHQYERLASWGLQTQAERRLGEHALLVGAEGYREEVKAPAFAVNPVSGVTTITRPRIPNGARYLNYGVFVQDIYEPEKLRRLRLSGSLRFGGASYQSKASLSPIVGGLPLWPNDSLSANALSGRAGATFRMAAPFWLHFNYSRGFRAPNITDLGTIGIQGNGNFETSFADIASRNAEIGDRADSAAKSTGTAVAKLRPETSDNLDYGFTVRTGRVRAEFNGFWNRLGNTVVSQTLILPQGAVGQALGDQIISRQLASGAVYVPAATNPVLVRANYGGARLKGLEQSLRVELTKSFSINQNYTWIEARDAMTGLPPDIEPGIPAPTGFLSLLYAPASKRVWVEFYGTAADRQTRLSSLSLSDRRIGAARSASNIANFFNNGARARGLVQNGLLTLTGETVAQVQQRVLGGQASAPLFSAVPGYVVMGIRGGFPVTRRSDVLVDFSNLADRNYRGIGWGIDALGRALTVKWRVRL
jgi:outer membrane receptor protein involved in Fe transport